MNVWQVSKFSRARTCVLELKAERVTPKYILTPSGGRRLKDNEYTRIFEDRAEAVLYARESAKKRIAQAEKVLSEAHENLRQFEEREGQ